MAQITYSNKVQSEVNPLPEINKFTAANANEIKNTVNANEPTNAVIGAVLAAATGKATPVDADTIPLNDSAATNALKKVTWANIKAVLKIYFDTLYTGGGGTAATTTFTPSGNIVATNAQTAIEELDAEKQPLDSDLTTIAAIAPSNDDIIQRKAGAWTNRTLAQVKTDLALVKADVGLGNVDNTSDAGKPVSTAQAAADAVVLASAQGYADGLVVGLWDDRGNFDASGGAYPSSGGSGSAGAILKGDIWTISVAGTLPTGQVVAIGDTVRAKQDTPGNTQANWAIQETNIGYTPVNKVGDTMSGNLAMGGNKVTGLAAASANGEAVRYEQHILKADLNSPSLTGTPTAPTAAQSVSNTQIATTAYVQQYTPVGERIYLYNNFV